jgi:hypothetical protein
MHGLRAANDTLGLKQVSCSFPVFKSFEILAVVGAPKTLRKIRMTHNQLLTPQQEEEKIKLGGGVGLTIIVRRSSTLALDAASAASAYDRTI